MSASKPSIPVTFWVPQELSQTLETYCANGRINKSAILRDALAIYLERAGAFNQIPIPPIALPRGKAQTKH